MGALRSFLLSYPEFLLAALCFLSLAALRAAVRARQQHAPVRWPVVGMLPFILGNIDRLLDATTDALRECRCTFVFRGPWLSRADFLVTCDPAAVQHCLASNHAGYDKGRDFAEMFDVVGDGLLVADAASWARQRHVAATVFGNPAFRSFVLSTMARQTARLLVPFLDHAAAAASPDGVEIEDVFMRYSLDVSYASAFGDDLDALSVVAASAPLSPFGQATRVASEAALLRHIVPAWWWRLLRWLSVGAERRLTEAKAVLDEFVYREIAKRKAQSVAVATGSQGGGRDLLSLYMAWPRDPGVTDRQRDQFLRDSAVGYMFAAKDLIVAALTWFFYILCTHPHVEAKILDELKSLRPTATVAATGGGEHAVFDSDALQHASYLHAAVLETLRLFPPAPFEEKEAVSDDVLPDGTKVAKGSRVIFCIYAMGRIEEIWGSDCHEFRPERWLSDIGRVRHEPSHKFAVFNCGPRSCLGKNLGLSNIKMAAAAILYNFQVELVEGHVVEPQNSVVLHTKNGMRVRIKRRKAA
ncbi:Alkane hydroxylase MAH1 [Dichanthelium oligosanthes]|uniref:Alkane hydroxylase MAH1 n=1 Tax=Dichanthelium oligosanthes TaxID=888268 RepID=A0A1E5UXF5_9POAL|nr:Alkane hydroxylase MAH1 [Dichanthelium oligosanthes]